MPRINRPLNANSRELTLQQKQSFDFLRSVYGPVKVLEFVEEIDVLDERRASCAGGHRIRRVVDRASRRVGHHII